MPQDLARAYTDTPQARRTITEYDTLRTRFETGRGQFRRREVAHLLERFGFSCVTDPNDAHARWQWKDRERKGSLKPMVVGLAGHGANPELDRAYVKTALDAIESILKMQQAYIALKNIRAFDEIENKIPALSGFSENTIVMEMLRDYMVVTRPHCILVRDQTYPEIGISIDAAASEDRVIESLAMLESLTHAHAQHLKKLEKDYGYVVVHDPIGGTKLSNSGYGLPTIELPKFGKGKFLGEQRGQDLTASELAMTQLAEQMQKATDQAEAVQREIVTVLADMQALGFALETKEEAVNGSGVYKRHTLKRPEKMEAFEYELSLLQDGFISRAPKVNNPRTNNIEGAEHAAAIAIAGSRKGLEMQDANSWIVYQNDDLKAPVMDTKTLRYLKATCSGFKTEITSHTNEALKAKYVIKSLPEPDTGIIEYSSIISPLSLRVSPNTPALSQTSEIYELILKMILATAKNVRVNKMLRDLGFESNQFGEKSIINFMAPIAGIFPDNQGHLELPHGVFGKCVATITNTNNANMRQVRDELIGGKLQLLHDIEQRIVDEIVGQGYTHRKEITGQILHHDSGVHIFTHQTTGVEIRMPIMNMYENNAGAIYRVFSKVHKEAQTRSAGDRVQKVIDELTGMFGYSLAEDKQEGAGRAVKLDAPFRGDKEIVSLHFNTNYPKRMDAVFGKEGNDKSIAKSESVVLGTACKTRIQRKHAALQAISQSEHYDVQQDSGKIILTDKRDGKTSELPTYGSAGLIHNKDLQTLEKAAGITRQTPSSHRG